MLELTLDKAIKHCKENVQKETQNGNLQCAAEHNQLAIWLSQLEESKSKAAAYDRLMSGGKVSNAKEAANFYGRPVASVDREWKVFENLPKYDGYRWWDMESRAFLSGETVHFNIDAFEGDEENSLTLPDGWEEK